MFEILTKKVKMFKSKFIDIDSCLVS